MRSWRTGTPEKHWRKRPKLNWSDCRQKSVADRFQAISGELGELHRAKFGAWKVPASRESLLEKSRD
jgi:hypothetical protein